MAGLETAFGGGVAIKREWVPLGELEPTGLVKNASLGLFGGFGNYGGRGLEADFGVRSVAEGLVG